MLKVAILIAASPGPVFYSQIAALSLALRKLRWTRWEPTVYAYFGGKHDADAYATWGPHLRDVEIICVSETCFARKGIWAQCDAIFELAPRDADVLLLMDADTLPVADLEDVLDQVMATRSIAGVIAHYTFPSSRTSSLEIWAEVASGLVDPPLDFAFSYTLMEADTSDDQLRTPCYVNFGVVFCPRPIFDDIALRYLSLRASLMERMSNQWFTGQVALTLAITAAKARTLALPMRYNFPNDPVAGKRYPEEMSHVVVFHYLRTENFDRHKIFTSAEEYAHFMALRLTGADGSFQRSVKRIMGPDYPFA